MLLRKTVLWANLLMLAPVSLHAQTQPLWKHMSDPLPLQCQPMVGHLNWQWRANVSNGEPKKQSPLYALQIGMDDTREHALENLKKGQSHSKTVPWTYQSCHNATAGQYLLFLAASVSDVACTAASAQVHLDWIYSQSPSTVLDAITTFDAAQSEEKLEEQDKKVLRAFVSLLYHERHNADALAVMRACFHDDPVALFGVVRRAVK